MELDFEESIESVGQVLDLVGVIIIVGGGIISCGLFLRAIVLREEALSAYQNLRQSLGRSILLGLEVLVAADIIRTVATDPTFENVGVLALIVLIRTFLSLSLEVELTGRWPWSRSGD